MPERHRRPDAQDPREIGADPYHGPGEPGQPGQVPKANDGGDGAREVGGQRRAHYAEAEVKHEHRGDDQVQPHRQRVEDERRPGEPHRQVALVEERGEEQRQHGERERAQVARALDGGLALEAE